MNVMEDAKVIVNSEEEKQAYYDRVMQHDKDVDRQAQLLEFKQIREEARAISEARLKAQRAKYGKGRGYDNRQHQSYRRKAF